MKKAIILSVLGFSMIFVGCKKDQSEIQGMVRYIDSAGIYYPANSAIITVHSKDTSASIQMTGNTDGDGIYYLTNVPDGDWVLRAVLQVDSNTTYIGVSQRFECKRSDFIAAPIDMTLQ